MDPHWFLELSLDEGRAEVNRHGLPVEDQQQGKKETNCWPSDDRCIRALFFFLEVTSHTVSPFVLLYLTIWSSLATERPCAREDLGFRLALGDFDPGSLLDQGTDFDLCRFNPLGTVIRPHCFFVGECVRVLDSTGLVTETGVGWTRGVEVVGEESAVAVTLSSIEAEPSWSTARSTRAAWWGRRWRRSGLDGSFLPLNRRCGHRRVIERSCGWSGKQTRRRGLPLLRGSLDNQMGRGRRSGLPLFHRCGNSGGNSNRIGGHWCARRRGDGQRHRGGLLESGGLNFLVVMLKRGKGVSGRIKGEWPMVGRVVIKNILVSAVPEDFVPFGGTKVRQLVRIGGYRRKPIIEHDVELGSDGAGLKVEDQGNG